MQDVYRFEDLQNWSATGGTEDPPIRLGIFGDPVEHSRSPQMQNAALEACRLHMRYARFHIRADELPAALRLLPSLGFIGVNLTIPHKMAAVAAVDEVDEFALSAGAINAVRVSGKALVGVNTDGVGFSRAIQTDLGRELRDLRVLLLGTGGAGRAIALQCARDGCKHLVLANRTNEKAQELAAELKASVIEWNDEQLRSQLAATDLVVNATSLGLKSSDPAPVPADSLGPQHLVYDTVYARHETALAAEARRAGARHANGLSMLLHQGALSFEKWFERPAPIEVMRAALLRD